MLHPAPAISVPSTQVAFRRHPLEGGLTFGKLLACLYLAAFSAYWLVALVSRGSGVRGGAGRRGLGVGKG